MEAISTTFMHVLMHLRIYADVMICILSHIFAVMHDTQNALYRNVCTSISIRISDVKFTILLISPNMQSISVCHLCDHACHVHVVPYSQKFLRHVIFADDQSSVKFSMRKFTI